MNKTDIGESRKGKKNTSNIYQSKNKIVTLVIIRADTSIGECNL